MKDVKSIRPTNVILEFNNQIKQFRRQIGFNIISTVSKLTGISKDLFTLYNQGKIVNDTQCFEKSWMKEMNLERTNTWLYIEKY
jgi:hypothetical protein